MELNRNIQSLKLDEIRELILNLTNATNSQDFTSLATTITSAINTTIANLKDSLLTTQNTTLEAEIKNKIIEVYTTLSSSISTLASVVSADSTTLSSVSTSITTILSNLSALSTQIQNKACGLTSTESQTLTNTYNNTTQILSSLSSASGGGEVDLSSITTALNIIELNLEEVLDRLELTSQDLQPTAPYDPPPEIIYKTRDTFASDYYYDISQPQDLHAEYFTINDDTPAMVKVEFDITASEAINDIEVKLHLSNIDILCDKFINAVNGTTHYCIYGAFLTERTDYYVKLNFSCGELKTFRVHNIVYEVVGNNANFLFYRHKYYTYNCNFTNYIFKVDNGAVSYFSTNALNPNYGQNFTTLVNNSGYNYWPMICTTYYNMPNQSGVTFLCIRIARQNKGTRQVEFIKDDGTLCGPVEFQQYYNDRIFAPINYSNGNYNFHVFRYGDINRIIHYGSLDNTCNSTMLNYSNTDFTNEDTLVAFSPYLCEMSYLQYGYNYGYMIFTTKSGQNYVNCVKGFNFNCNIGYGTRVMVGEVPNYQGSINSTSSTRVFRAFMYVYDHWKVIYYKHGTGRTMSNFQILGTKVLNGDYDEVHPGFNGEYFTVKNGQIVCHDDADVVKTQFN